MSGVILLESIKQLTDKYDIFILDLWGVIHDGQHTYPNAKRTLEALKQHNKRIVLLSNAPRRAQTVAEMMLHMGITSDMYDKIVTSGEVFYQCLAHPEKSFFKPHGRHYIYIGLEKDRHILGGLNYTEVKQPESAQFVLLSHSFYDNQPIKELVPLMKECIKAKLPLLCVNPDKEVVSLSGHHVYCAGILAEEYRMMGGEITYFGKPHRAVYEASLEGLEHHGKKRIIAIGDSLGTDIAGAARTGLANVLVTGGIVKKTLGEPSAPDYKEKLDKLFRDEGIKPDYVIPEFIWQ
ncbi:MAG TPA: TIGR01459 family HAD-type hydrolase [Rickettsiales bacterium]|nr:TIGR01459 family HAD-type hydrolase [Rickettsiales bacterium]